MPKKGRKLTPAQRAVALKNLRKARAARKRGPDLTPAKGKGSRPSKKKLRASRRRHLSDRRRKALGYHKERTVATRKKRKGGAKKRRGGGRRGGRGIMSGIDWMNMAGAGAYGWLEKQAVSADPGRGEQAYLKKVPLFFEGVGYAGCTAILAHLIGRNVGGTVGRVARHIAAGTFDVAAYKLAKNGKLYESKEAAEAALAGDDDLSGDDELGDDEVGIELEGDEEMGYGADGIAGDDD